MDDLLEKLEVVPYFDDVLMHVLDLDKLIHRINQVLTCGRAIE